MSGLLARIPWRLGTGRRAIGVVLVVLVVLVATLGVQWWFWQDRTSAEDAGHAATDAAAAAVTRLLSYDAASMDTVSRTIDETTTGGFHDQFASLFTQVVRPNAVAQKASSTATVVARALVEAGSDHAVVLLFVNQSTVSQKLAGERVDTVETRVTMQEVDGRWLVSQLDQV